MKVGFALLTLFPGRVGGTETYVRGLLSELARGRDCVVVLANGQVAREYGDDGAVSVHRVPTYREGDSMVTRSLVMARARVLPGRVARGVPDGLDLVHYPVTVPIPKVDAPTVVTLHDVAHHDVPGMFSRGERAFRRWGYDGAAQAADSVLTVSEFSRGRIIETLGIEPERVVSIPHGIDYGLFRPLGPSDALSAIDLPERFLLYPANLWRHKNHERLVRAFETLDDPGLWLLLTGETYGRPVPEAPRVRHLGYVTGEALAALYRRAEAVVFPSLYEGFGSPVLEAMASGCPVASSNAAALPEVCGGAAELFDPERPESIAEAIAAVTGDGRERLVAAGFERAQDFTWAESAARHLEVYAEVAKTNAP